MKSYRIVNCKLSSLKRIDCQYILSRVTQLKATMSFSSFKPPKELDSQGNVAQMWKRFIAEFDILLCVTGLDEKPKKQQVICLLNVIGANGRALYDTMQFEDGDKLKLTLYPKTKRTNRKRNPKTSESGVQYVSVLRKLAESCNFGVEEDKIIRDQLVRGMLSDEKLKDKLHAEDNHNLKKAFKIITTHEMRATMTSLKRGCRIPSRPRLWQEPLFKSRPWTW